MRVSGYSPPCHSAGPQQSLSAAADPSCPPHILLHREAVTPAAGPPPNSRWPPGTHNLRTPCYLHSPRAHPTGRAGRNRGHRRASSDRTVRASEKQPCSIRTTTKFNVSSGYVTWSVLQRDLCCVGHTLPVSQWFQKIPQVLCILTFALLCSITMAMIRNPARSGHQDEATRPWPPLTVQGPVIIVLLMNFYSSETTPKLGLMRCRILL